MQTKLEDTNENTVVFEVTVFFVLMSFVSVLFLYRSVIMILGSKNVWRYYIMCKENELSFSIYMLYSLADKWNKSPGTVYKILNSTGILDNYIIPCYDVLHTQGKEYLIEDITEYAREKGVNV